MLKHECLKYLCMITGVILGVIIGYQVGFKILLMFAGLVIGYLAYRLLELLLHFISLKFRQLKDRFGK